MDLSSEGKTLHDLSELLQVRFVALIIKDLVSISEVWICEHLHVRKFVSNLQKVVFFTPGVKFEKKKGKKKVSCLKL